NGKVVKAARFERAREPISAHLGQFGDVVYAGSQDYNLYAVDTGSGKQLWRFTGGAPIVQQPTVTNKDVFVTPTRMGLFRLDRLTGDEKWLNKQADRVLSVNARAGKGYVYATDRSGRLLILDYATGKSLATYDTSDYVVPVSNEWTDRFFLA